MTETTNSTPLGERTAHRRAALDGSPVHDDAEALLRGWRTASTVAAGAPIADWDGPTVLAMVRALLDDTGVERAIGALARDRADRGVSLREGLTDLAALFTAAERAEPSYRLAGIFASHWCDATSAGIMMHAVVDALTGLATAEYLVARLREVYAEEERPAAERMTLVVIDSATSTMSGWHRVIRASSIARIMHSTFHRGQTNAVLPSGRFISLVRHDAHMRGEYEELRACLARENLTTDTAPVRTWIEPLPSSARAAERLLIDL